MDKPLVSIVICCHNRAHLLPMTLASALAQNYGPAEIIVFDDGSTDETPRLMEKYKEHISYYRQENQGIAAARTHACDRANGEYIAFLDDDDLMPPGRIEVLYQALQQHTSAVYAAGDWMVIDEGGNLTGRRWLPEHTLSRDDKPILVKKSYEAVLWPRLPIAPHTTLFRKVDGERIGWFDPQFRYASEDKDFFARLARLGPIVYVPKVVSYYRRGHGSMTANTIRTEYGSLFLFHKHMQSLDSSQEILRSRLEWRILTALKRITLYRNQGVELPAGVPDNYLDTWLSELKPGNRLRYHWYASIKLPLRQLIRR